VFQIPICVTVGAGPQQFQRPNGAAHHQPTGGRGERDGEQSQPGDLPIQRADRLGDGVERQGRACHGRGTPLRAQRNRAVHQVAAQRSAQSRRLAEPLADRLLELGPIGVIVHEARVFVAVGKHFAGREDQREPHPLAAFHLVADRLRGLSQLMLGETRQSFDARRVQTRGGRQVTRFLLQVRLS
jgi:hypothetical protein